MDCQDLTTDLTKPVVLYIFINMDFCVEKEKGEVLVLTKTEQQFDVAPLTEQLHQNYIHPTVLYNENISEGNHKPRCPLLT